MVLPAATKTLLKEVCLSEPSGHAQISMSNSSLLCVYDTDKTCLYNHDFPLDILCASIISIWLNVKPFVPKQSQVCVNEYICQL